MRDGLAEALKDRYRFERELGAGGMATVYLAQDLKHNRQVAIKVLREDLSAALGARRFLREIEIAAQLQHPHILPLLDSGEAAGLLYYVMPYVDGESLRQKLAREGALPIAETSRVLREVADALAKAHKAGIVHRDIKPENILLSDGHALVMDFGIARAVSDAARNTTLTQSGMAVGTPAYMAPEQAAADPNVDARADVYALGVVAYEMLSGRTPFTGATAQQVLAAQITATPDNITTHRTTVPAPLATLVMQCLAKHPADRPQSALALVQTLDGVITPTPLAAAPSAPHIYPARIGMWVAGFCGFAAVAFIAWSLIRSGKPAPASALHTIAVLSIDVNGDTINAPFADGISDGVRNDLGRVPGIRVIGRASSTAFDRTASATDVRKRLANVDAVLQGALSRAGPRLHLVAELDDAKDGHQIWGTSLDLEIKDLYSVQDSIKSAIVAALQLKLAAATPAANGRTRNPKAYEQYLIGRHEIDFVEVDLHRAIAHFDSAIAIDPTFAPAYAGISLAWSYLADEYLAPDSSYPQMKAAALKAVQLDSTSADAHTALALALMWKDFDVKGAIAEFERAGRIDPNSAEVREIYANVLFAANPAAGIAQADRALALDPLSGFASYMRAACLYGAKRYREAIEQANRTEELTPNLVYYDVVDAASLRELKDYPAAVARYRKAQPYSNKPLFGLGVTYARQGLRDSALRVAHDLERLAKTQYVTPSLIAMIFANLPTAADRDTAFKWLDEGLRVHSAILLFLDTPELDPIRNDPRYAKFVALGRETKTP